MDQVSAPYKQGFDFGMGVKSATANPMALGVVGAVSSVEAGASGGTGQFSLSRIETTYELEEKLGISAAASGGVGLFSASARFDFAKECKVRATSLTLVIHCTEQFGFKQIDEPRLSPDAGALVEHGRLDLFANRYGNCFVRGIQTGGQFFGVIRIDARSEDSREEISASISGSYGAFSAEVGSTFSSRIREERASVDVFAFWEGGRVTKKPATPVELIAAADEWSSTVEDRQRPYFVTLAPYVLALGPEPPNEADLARQRDVLIRCAKLRSLTMDKLNLLDYLLDPRHVAEFAIVPPPAGPDLAAIRTGVARDLDVIADAASFALNNPKDALMPEIFAREKRNLASYVATELPVPLPDHVGPSVRLPDFTAIGDKDSAERLAADVGVKLDWSHEDAAAGTLWKIVRQDPPGGTEVASGATVKLTSRSGAPLLLYQVDLGPSIAGRLRPRNR